MSPEPNISVGTQVVITSMDSASENGAPIHPSGAVGVITRSPAAAGEPYTVRFPDGATEGYPREQLQILRRFRELRKDSCLHTPFRLEEHILYRCVMGSIAFGLETKDSDRDIRGVYQAPSEMVWSLHGAPEQFEDNQGQECYWEIQKFLKLVLKANPNVLECLYSPRIEKVTPGMQRVLEIRQRFLSRMLYQTYNGYALSQFKKISQDLRNHGQVRWKHAMHLLRLLISGAEALRTAAIPVEVGPMREPLLEIKSGAWSWERVDAWRKELHADFDRALKETPLPERPDYDAANDLLIQLRREAAR